LASFKGVDNYGEFSVSRVKAKFLVETLVPLFNEKLGRMLVKNGKAEDLFEFIAGEMTSGNCLEALSELSSVY
jgi:hypothetical protein